MLQQISERVMIAPGAVNIGVVAGPDKQAILIDTGLNDTSARKVLRWLGSEGYEVSAIITTHGHADHFGGNAFVVKRTAARVWAPRWDEAVLRYPLFQSVCLFGGADPPADLRSGFLLADPSPVDYIFDEGSLTVAGVELEAVSLAGHSGNQMGLMIDDVFFCADVVLPAQVLAKYKIPYLFSVRDHLRSLEAAREIRARTIVPGHGPMLDDINDLADQNLRIVERVADHVLDVCCEPTTPEEILASVLTHFDADASTAGAYFLLHPTIFAFLTYLQDAQRLVSSFEDGRSLWRAVN